MSRLHFIEPDEAKGLTKEIFQRLVLVPNVLCLIANSGPVLEIYADHHATLPKYKLSARHQKMISLAVSQFNDCSYCIALHTASAVDGKILTKSECIEARKMKSHNPKDDAVLNFTKQVLGQRGHVDEDALLLIKSNGFDDREIVEVMAVISFITLANFTANVGKPEMDFLEAPEIN